MKYEMKLDAGIQGVSKNGMETPFCCKLNVENGNNSHEQFTIDQHSYLELLRKPHEKKEQFTDFIDVKVLLSLFRPFSFKLVPNWTRSLHKNEMNAALFDMNSSDIVCCS